MYHTLSAWDAYNNLAPQKAGCSRIVQRLFAGCIVIFDDEKSYQLFNFNGKKKTDHSQKKKIWHDAWDFMMGQILACFWYICLHEWFIFLWFALVAKCNTVRLMDASGMDVSYVSGSRYRS